MNLNLKLKNLKILRYNPLRVELSITKKLYNFMLKARNTNRFFYTTG